LDHGRVRQIGPIGQVITAYQDHAEDRRCLAAPPLPAKAVQALQTAAG
jgi:hypothetical protein